MCYIEKANKGDEYYYKKSINFAHVFVFIESKINQNRIRFNYLRKNYIFKNSFGKVFE